MAKMNGRLMLIGRIMVLEYDRGYSKSEVFDVGDGVLSLVNDFAESNNISIVNADSFPFFKSPVFEK